MQKNSEVNNYLCFWLKLIIRGEKINFGQLTALLEIQPTEIYKWSGSEKEEPLDAWYYRVKIESSEQFESASKKFFTVISEVSRKLKGQNTYAPEIVLLVHSDMAQIYFDFPQSMLQSLEELKIPFSISILSWGMVEDQNEGFTGMNTFQ